jgi:hypothetical protein
VAFGTGAGYPADMRTRSSHAMPQFSVPYGVVIDDAKLFNDKLREWEDFYNNHRPHGGLNGQTLMNDSSSEPRPGCNLSPSLAQLVLALVVTTFSRPPCGGRPQPAPPRSALPRSPQR